MIRSLAQKVRQAVIAAITPPPPPPPAVPVDKVQVRPHTRRKPTLAADLAAKKANVNAELAQGVALRRAVQG